MMNDANKETPPPALVPTSSAMVPIAPRARLAQLDREHLAALVDDDLIEQQDCDLSRQTLSS